MEIMKIYHNIQGLASMMTAAPRPLSREFARGADGGTNGSFLGSMCVSLVDFFLELKRKRERAFISCLL